MATSTDGYSLQTTINLPGTVGGHGDIVTYDDQTNTVWLAQSPDNNVVVIDAKTNAVEATIPNIGNANGIALSENYAFVADPTNDTLDVINKHNFKLVDQIHLAGSTPDGVIYDPSTHQVAVAMDDQNTLEFYDANTFKPVGTTQLTTAALPGSAGPDVPTYVASKDLIYQPDNAGIEVIDPHTHQIVKTFSFDLPADASTKPVVYDPYSNELLVGTTNKEILVVNADSGHVDHTIGITGSVDQSTIDVGAGLAFFGDKAGTADVVQLGSDTLVGGLPTEAGAHTLTVDTDNHSVYAYLGNSNKVAVYTPTAPQAEDLANTFHGQSDDYHGNLGANASSQVTGAVHQPHDGLLHA